MPNELGVSLCDYPEGVKRAVGEPRSGGCRSR